MKSTELLGLEELEANCTESLEALKAAELRRDQARTPIGRFIGGVRLAWREMIAEEDQALWEVATYDIPPQRQPEAIDFGSNISL